MSLRLTAVLLAALVAIGALAAVAAPERTTNQTAIARSTPPRGLPGGGACTAPELSLLPGPGPTAPLAAGQQRLSLAVRNRGARTCTVAGAPRLRFYATAVLLPFRYAPVPVGRAAAARAVSLTPGATAAFTVTRTRCEAVDAGSRRVSAAATRTTKAADTVTVQPDREGAQLGYALRTPDVFFCADPATGKAAPDDPGNLLAVSAFAG